MARADRMDPSERLDRFAELLSLNIPVLLIAERMCIGKGAAHALKMKLERMYGGPAV